MDDYFVPSAATMHALLHAEQADITYFTHSLDNCVEVLESLSLSSYTDVAAAAKERLAVIRRVRPHG